MCLGVHHLKEDDGVDLDGHVVRRDDLLLRDHERVHTQVDFGHSIDARNDHEQARAPEWSQPTEPEDDPSLVLLRDLDGRARQRQKDQDYGGEYDERE